MIEPRKEVAEADAVRERGRQHLLATAASRLCRGHRAGHVSEGFPESWEISATPTSGGTAERRKRSEAEVAEKSERLDSSEEEGEPGRRDPLERSEAPEQGTVWRKDGRDIGLGSRLNEN